jgi:2-methylcitrate dehydratase PrpD
MPAANDQDANSFINGLTGFSRGFRSAALPDEALRRSIDAITDTIACAVLGARQPLEPRLRRTLFGAQAGKKDLGEVLSPASLKKAGTDAQGSVALYLGTLAHAADFDDISHPAYCHASALLLPGLLVRAAITGRSGADLVRAHIFGFEVLGQLGRRLNPAHYERGWHSTGTLGTVAATAAICHLENFSAEATRTALGIAASLAGGVRENFGTMTKPLHAGLAARSAILATRLAAEDFTSAADGIEGKNGFFKVLGGSAQPKYRKDWGAPLEIMTEHGIGLKAFPCCAATHPAIDAAMAVRKALGNPAWGDIESVRVGATRLSQEPLAHDDPHDALEAKFSMPYAVSTALCDGIVNQRSFTEAQVQRADIRAVMQRVTWGVDERVADDTEFAAIVEVKLKSGKTHTQRIDVASGKPGNWLTSEAVRGKFEDCLGDSAKGAQGKALYESARGLYQSDSMESLQVSLANCIAAEAA